MIKNLGLSIVAVLVVLCTSELALRNLGWTPGVTHYNQWFNPVDSLVPLKGFESDEHGIFKVDTSLVQSLSQDLRDARIGHKRVGAHAKKIGISSEIAALVFDHVIALDNDSVNALLPFRSLDSGAEISCLDSVVVHYLNNPINADGFYSIPVNCNCEGKTKVMLIGDSFTWGHSTSNNLFSFSNRLLARDYAIHNFGISGADVSQYQQILKTYLEIIDPDIILVNFYMGNDVAFHQRTPKALVPIFFSTNAGNLYSFRKGKEFLSMDEAYGNVISKTFVPEENWFERLVGSLAVTTLCWKVVSQYDDWWTYYSNRKLDDEVPVSTIQLIEMQHFCQVLGYDMRIVVIPEFKNGVVQQVELESKFFQGLNAVCPILESNFYNQDDGHFNDKGHLFYANFLDSLITRQFGSK
ncbi:SGNH/GDSL hydrolase family protein [Flavobacteriales bacterium]|nr:SGNH/GDSL hydrolase family protein [Flavobacteriales bacterium]